MERLRQRQIRNFAVLVMLANGTPMFRAGDEFGQTQGGNNNPYNQDNETTWLDWTRLDDRRDLHRFWKLLIAFRKSHPSIGRGRYWRDDISWYGVDGPIDLGHWSKAFAYHLSGAEEDDDDLYVMVNAFHEPLAFEVQVPPVQAWLRVLDTARPSPHDIVERSDEAPASSLRVDVAARSIVVLRQPRPITEERA